MTSNNKTISVEVEAINYKNLNITLYILRISTTLYHTYKLLYCTVHIQMTSNYTTMEVEGEEIKYKYERSYSIYFAFILHYITLTKYYNVQDTIRWTVTTAQQMWKEKK